MKLNVKRKKKTYVTSIIKSILPRPMLVLLILLLLLVGENLHVRRMFFRKYTFFTFFRQCSE